jgi:hypothetical protein
MTIIIFDQIQIYQEICYSFFKWNIMEIRHRVKPSLKERVCRPGLTLCNFLWHLSLHMYISICYNWKMTQWGFSPQYLRKTKSGTFFYSL